MSALRAIWGFVVGEDWSLALGAVLSLAVTAIVAAADLPAWWVAPTLIPLLLLASIRRALSAVRPSDDEAQAR